MPETRRLSDAEIAAALFGAAERPGERSSCPADERYWELVCGELSAQQAGTLLDHAATCVDCVLALHGAREVFDASGIAAPASLPARIWSFLSGTVLRPLPALAYLVLLALSIPSYRFLSDGDVGPALRSLRVVPLRGEIVLRGDGDPPAPLRVPLGETEAPVLQILLDVDRLRAGDAADVLLVRLLREESVVAETSRRVSDIDADGALALALDRALLQPGPTYRVEVTSAALGPNAPPVFRQSFRVDPAHATR